MSFFKRLFGSKKNEEELPPAEFTDEQYENDYTEKLKGLEEVLGKMYEMVGHAVIPFSVGGAVDMYYFPHHIPGTGFATMELLDPAGNGPLPNRMGTYELVAFTKEPLNPDDKNPNAFNAIERRVCGIFTMIGNYSQQAVLNPLETCEIPDDEEANRCLVLYNYQPGDKGFMIGERKHHLLLCIEIFRSEMDFARDNGSEALVGKLKSAGYYPYSDLDRPAVA